MKVLLAGEDEFVLKFLKVKFQELGSESDIVLTADEALKSIDTTGYQAVIVDFAIQVQSKFLEGWTLHSPRPPVVVLSLLKEEADIAKALGFGINLFIHKQHVQMQDIVEVVMKVIRGEPIPNRSGFRVPGVRAVDQPSHLGENIGSIPTDGTVAEPRILESVASEKAPVIAATSRKTDTPVVTLPDVRGPDQPVVDVKPMKQAGDRHPRTQSDSAMEEVEIEVES